jgi:exodeoxyribonuclease VII large subunit
VQRQRLEAAAARLRPGVSRGVERAQERLAALAKLYAAVDPERPLQRGFARVTRADGSIVREGASLASGEAVAIKVGDAVTRGAVIDGAAADPLEADKAPRARPAPKAKPAAPAKQGDLF